MPAGTGIGTPIDDGIGEGPLAVSPRDKRVDAAGVQCAGAVVTQDYPHVRDLEFTVAICTLDRCTYLKRAADELLAQLADFRHGTLLVIDNGSTDGTAEYLASLQSGHDKVKTVREDRRGNYYARARAIEEACGEFLIFLDDDAVPQPRWLEGMLQELAATPDIGAVGCAIDPIWEGQRPAWLSDRLLREVPAFSIAGGREEGHFPRYPPTIALGIRLNACATLYVAPERRLDYPLGRTGTGEGGATYERIGGEDSDLCEIYTRCGFRVFSVDHIRVSHTVPPERLTPGWYLRKFWNEGRLRIRLLRLAGYPILSRHSVAVLGLFPAFLFLNFIHGVFPARQRLLVQAYYMKCTGAWSEVLWGPRLKPLPYGAPPGGQRPKGTSHVRPPTRETP